MRSTGKKAIFIASQKGGAGKTTFARVLLDYYRELGIGCAAFDADGQVGQLLQYYGARDEHGVLVAEQDPMHGVGYFDIQEDDERDILVNAIDTQADVVLVDLPGGAMTSLGKVLGNVQALFNEYRQEGYRVIVVLVITPVLASTRTVSETIKLFGDSVEYVVVKNLAFGDSDEFVIFDGFTDEHGHARYGRGKAALEEVGGMTIEMPRLNAATYALLDVESLRFADASVAVDRLSRAHRSRVFNWINDVRSNVESCAGAFI